MSAFQIVIAISVVCILIFGLLKWRRYRRITAFKGGLLDEVNYIRVKAKLKPLGRVRFLDRVAVRHSRAMAGRKQCDHDGYDRRAALIKDKMGVSDVAENCYMFTGMTYGDQVARELIRASLKLEAQRAGMLNRKFARTGIGIVVRRGHGYITQIFTD